MSPNEEFGAMLTLIGVRYCLGGIYYVTGGYKASAKRKYLNPSVKDRLL